MQLPLRDFTPDEEDLRELLTKFFDHAPSMIHRTSLQCKLGGASVERIAVGGSHYIVKTYGAVLDDEIRISRAIERTNLIRCPGILALHTGRDCRLALIEDFGSQTLDALASQHALEATVALARFHRESTAVQREYVECFNSPTTDATTLVDEINFLLNIDYYDNALVSKSLLGSFAVALDGAIEILAPYPHSLLHGDVHLRNWLFPDNGAPGLIDWARATVGCGYVDLVRFIMAPSPTGDRFFSSALKTSVFQAYSDHSGLPLIKPDVYSAAATISLADSIRHSHRELFSAFGDLSGYDYATENAKRSRKLLAVLETIIHVGQCFAHS